MEKQNFTGPRWIGSQRRTENLQLKLTSTEKEALTNVCAQYGVSISKFIRDLLDPIIGDENYRIWREREWARIDNAIARGQMKRLGED